MAFSYSAAAAFLLPQVIIHTETSQASFLYLVSSTSVTETTPDINEVPFTTPRCFHTALFEDTKTRVKVRTAYKFKPVTKSPRSH